MSIQPRILLVLNPNAGRSEIRTRLLDILQTLTAAGFSVTVRPTLRAGEVGEILQSYRGQYDIVVTCGGDGTLNETVNGLMALPERPPLGYLPSGTVNDFAHTLGIPRSMSEAAQLIGGSRCAVDIGRFGDRYFSYIAAFGAFTEVAYQTPQQNKMYLGRTAYILEGIKRLPVLRPYPLRAEGDGFSLEGEFLFGMVTNTSSVGGFRLTDKHQVSLSDGLLEVTLVRNPQNVGDLSAIINSILQQNFNSEFVHSYKSARASFSCPDPVPWTLDGEFGGNPREIEISVIPGALQVFCPDGQA